MNRFIIPYKDRFSSAIGNYIDPYGNFISLNVVHEEFAKNYCRGSMYHKLLELKNSEDLDTYQELLEFYSGYKKRSKSFAEYISSELSDEELMIYKLWDRMNPYDSTNFLVQVLGWDKIESSIYKNISTSSDIPHIRFYNYYLMDWDIYVLPKIVFDWDKKEFIKKEKVDNSTLLNHKDATYEEELIYVKRYIKDMNIRSAYIKK